MNMLIKKVSIGRGSSFEGSCFSNTEDQAHCWFPAGAHKDFGRLGHKAQIRPRALGISRFKPKLMGWEVRGSSILFNFLPPSEIWLANQYIPEGKQYGLLLGTTTMKEMGWL